MTAALNHETRRSAKASQQHGQIRRTVLSLRTQFKRAKTVLAVVVTVSVFIFAPAAVANTSNDPDVTTDANKDEKDDKVTDRHKEMWVGADAGDNYWLVYSGTTLAPFTDIHQNGLRLRVVGGYGQYSYQIASEARATKNFDAQVNFADALIGYL